MAKQLLNLRGVPDDEAEDVRALLHRNRVEFYELPAGPYLISAGSLWIRHDHEYERARELFGQYQAERLRNARDQAETTSLLRHFRQQPLKVVVYGFTALLVVALMAWPIVALWKA
ncbi:MAG: DUF6164 family protein [Wenzhouxiangellaceae bacterium]